MRNFEWTITITFTGGAAMAAAFETYIGKFFRGMGLGFSMQHESKEIK